MKWIIIILLLAFLNVNAQTTAIPDTNFEQALINLGLDTGIPDGVVLTANIDTLDSLNVSGKNISSLVGVQDFLALTYLDCNNNQLTSLDIAQNTSLTNLNCWSNLLDSLNLTQNTNLVQLTCTGNQLTSLNLTYNSNLTHLYCQFNQLGSLDLSQNTALAYLYCADNLLTSMDITQNISLILLWCRNNKLTSLNITQNINLIDFRCQFNQLGSLDLTKNTALSTLWCPFNQLTSLNVTQNSMLNTFGCSNNLLTCLNIKNNNNSIIYSFSADSNPNLLCIEVDNIAYPTANWTNIDPQTSFSTNCPNPCLVGINENNFAPLSLYPNPTTGNISIDLGEIQNNLTTTLTNNLGQILWSENYNSTSFINLEINTPKGIYFLRLETDGEVIAKKIIKE